MEQVLIKVEHAVKKFKETLALNDVSVEFEKGKITGLIGRNGSGKSVLLKCICGLMPLTSGKVYIDGKEVRGSGPDHANIGAIIETPGFLDNFNGYANLKYLAQIRGKMSKEQIYQVMETVGLDPKSRKWVGKYSLGMRQRLGIAQAIMEDQEILLLDEPMNGLDKDGVKEIRELLLKLKEQGKTIVLCSHNAQDIELLCDTVYEMEKGVLTKITGGKNV